MSCVNFRESEDKCLEKDFIGPDDEGNASTDDEASVETEDQGSRAKRTRRNKPAEQIPCLYCGSVFKGDRGIQQHERFCQKKKDMTG